MWYLVLVLFFVAIILWIEKKTFRWETVVKHLWKQVYVKAGRMVSHMEQFNIINPDELGLEGFKGQIEFRGKLINSILDYINNIKREEDSSVEEETFGYGRYDFDTILYVARTHPDSFKKFK